MNWAVVGKGVADAILDTRREMERTALQELARRIQEQELANLQTQGEAGRFSLEQARESVSPLGRAQTWLNDPKAQPEAAGAFMNNLPPGLVQLSVMGKQSRLRDRMDIQNQQDQLDLETGRIRKSGNLIENRLRRAQANMAEKQLESMENPPPPSELDRLKYESERLKYIATAQEAAAKLAALEGRGTGDDLIEQVARVYPIDPATGELTPEAAQRLKRARDAATVSGDLKDAERVNHIEAILDALRMEMLLSQRSQETLVFPDTSNWPKPPPKQQPAGPTDLNTLLGQILNANR